MNTCPILQHRPLMCVKGPEFSMDRHILSILYSVGRHIQMYILMQVFTSLSILFYYAISETLKICIFIFVISVNLRGIFEVFPIIIQYFETSNKSPCRELSYTKFISLQFNSRKGEPLI